MKKKDVPSRLSLDKETIARLNEDQLSLDQAQEIEGGASTQGPSCCGEGKTGTYTSCPH